MSIGDKRRPPSLVLSQDKSKSDMIMRIVSPITPQFVNSDMRDTLKISEVIRLQQNELIAASNYEKRHAARRTPVSSNWADAPRFTSSSGSSSGESVKNTEITPEIQGDEHDNSIEMDHESDHSDAGHDAIENQHENKPEIDHHNDIENDDDNDNSHKIEDNSENENENKPENTSNNGNYVISTASPIRVLDHDHDDVHPVEPANSPLAESELERLGDTFSRKSLKRNNAPGPLRISPGSASNFAPKINSAPIRPLYGPYALRRQPVRYLYSSVGPYPQTAIQFVPMAVRRAANYGPERVYKPRSPRGPSARRRKPVMDVFEGQVAKLAPMPSQPPSAQAEHFTLSSSEDEVDGFAANGKKEAHTADDDVAPQEVGRKRPDAALRGTISFNDESAFNFTIFQGNKSSAKKKFMEVCETTWDKYAAASEM